MARGTRKNRNEDLLLQALACGATHEAAARQAGVTSRTVTRRLADPKFRRELSKIRGEMVSRTTGMLTAASFESVKTLLDLQKSGTPAVKLGAARSVLEFASKLREVVDLESQLHELQAQLDAMESARGKPKSYTQHADHEPWASE